MSGKFKAEVFKQFRASDGSTHETREAHEKHERRILVDRVAGYVAGDLDAAILGNNTPVAVDIISLASLLRPPRAKRGAGQSAAGPISATAPSTTASTETAQTHAADELATAAISAAENERIAAEHGIDLSTMPPVPEAHDGQGAAAPSEQPEAAGDPPSPVASELPEPTDADVAETTPRSHRRGKVIGHARTAQVEGVS